ncbi:MAG TPA: hypothetical protein GXZ36_00585 [Firmicutes bacterium]|nr:hypothetical protein [Bacillota bacterium]
MLTGVQRRRTDVISILTILLLIISLFTIGKRGLFSDRKEARISIAESTETTAGSTGNLSQETKGSWSAYGSLRKEVNAFFQQITNWGPKNSAVTSRHSAEEKRRNNQGDALSELLSYRLEIRERAQLNAETLKRFAADLEREFQSRLQKKKEQISKEIEEATEDKRLSMERKITEYNKQIEAEYFLQLTNIQFKLQLPGLPEEDQVRLKEEMAKIKDEMQVKTVTRTAEFEEELAAFIQRRVAAGEAELVNFERELLMEMRIRYQEEKSRLEEDFVAWQRRKEEELKREGADIPRS